MKYTPLNILIPISTISYINYSYYQYLGNFVYTEYLAANQHEIRLLRIFTNAEEHEQLKIPFQLL